MLLVDSHCHIHKGKSGTGALTGGRGEKDSWKTQPTLFEGDTTCVVASNAEKLDCGDVILYCSMAVEEGDWAMLISMEEQGQQHKAVAAGGLGIHPWKAHEAKPGWESRLREALIRRPSLLVGEIGLDKSREADKTGWEIQLKMFEEQMELAAELRRPVSIHCVRAYGTIYDWLKKRPMATECPPSLAFHSYTGSPEMAAAFLALPHLKGSVFFGFSLSVCLRSPATETRLYNVLSVLPRESLLLESDLDDRCAVRVAMMRMCEVVARATGVQRQSLAEITTRNAERFLRRALV